MTDQTTGAIREDILNEKVLSAIVEIKTPLERVPRLLEVVEKVSKRLPTVVSLGVSTRCHPDGSDPLKAILDRAGYHVYRGKTNAGLGRLTNAAVRPATAEVPVAVV